MFLDDDQIYLNISSYLRQSDHWAVDLKKYQNLIVNIRPHKHRQSCEHTTKMLTVKRIILGGFIGYSGGSKILPW